MRNILLIIIVLCPLVIFGQLKIGSVHSKVNFREGPGLRYKIKSSIDKSNLLVLLPRPEKNGFVEVFDVESSAHGYVSKSLIQVMDTLQNKKQKFFEESKKNVHGDIEIVLINRTAHNLFVWINEVAYNIDPREKKVIIMDESKIRYFCSTPASFPVFGSEILTKGNTYRWDFSL